MGYSKRTESVTVDVRIFAYECDLCGSRVETISAPALPEGYGHCFACDRLLCGDCVDKCDNYLYCEDHTPRKIPIQPYRGPSMVVSGASTEMEVAALHAARQFGIVTGGLVHPSMARAKYGRDVMEVFGLAAHRDDATHDFWVANARESDATIWFVAAPNVSLFAVTKECIDLSRPILRVHGGENASAFVLKVVDWMSANRVQKLNVVTDCPAHHLWNEDSVRSFLTTVFASFQAKGG